MRLHELLHYGDTRFVLGDFDRNAAAPEPSLLAHKGAILPAPTRGMRYSTIAPLHMAQGESVVSSELSGYTFAGSLPAFSRASISA